MSAWRGLAQPVRYATLLAGALPVLAFPETDLGFLAWFGFVPGFALIRLAPSAREAAVRGWWLGAGYLLAALYWLIPNIGPALLLVAIVLGAPWAGVGYAVWRLLARGGGRRPELAAVSDSPGPAAAPARGDGPPEPLAAPTLSGAQEPAAAPAQAGDPPGPATAPAEAGDPPESAEAPRSQGPGVLQALAGLVVVPSCLVVIDWLRSWQRIGGPWAVFGASQWQHPTVLALAAIGGIWLVSFALVLANTGIAIAIFAVRWPARLTGAVAAAVAVAAGPIAFALMSGPAAAAGPPARLRLALVQPGLVPGGPVALIADESRLTARARDADLVIWGESSLGENLAGRHVLLASLRRLAATAPLLVSQDAYSPDGSHSKVAVLIGPGGVEGTYVKTRLVPFGEYIPLRPVLGWLTKISRAAQVNMIAGRGAKVLHTTLPDGRRLAFGVLICFESSFPDMARVDASHGARLIVYQTSDSTFQGSWAPAQHASLGALRAAETGRPVVQAALTGDSAAFDARGRLLAWAGTSERGVLRVTLTLPDGRYATPYDRLGDYVPPVAIGVVLLAIGGPALIRRYRRR